MISLEPSLLLLLCKIIVIFIITFFMGGTLFFIKINRTKPLLAFPLYCLVGAVFLNVSCIWSAMLGYPAGYGVYLPLIVLSIRVIFVLSRKGDNFFYINKKNLITIALLSSIACVSYILPFAIKNTSGFYSRGGGDHSTYLSISDWAVDNALYGEFNEEYKFPPNPHWELYGFLSAIQKGVKQNHPIANQLLFTPFMKILPGSSEETYTAAVAFYLTMTAWSVFVLFGVLFPYKNQAQRPWRFVPLFLSNLLLYTSTTHAIPFLYSIALLNISIALYLIYSDKLLLKKTHLYLPLAFISGALFSIYPHMFVIQNLIFGFILLIFFRNKKFNNLLLLSIFSFIGSLFITNVLVLGNIDLLIWSSSVSGAGGATPYIYNVLSTFSGVLDYLRFSPLEHLNQWSLIGLFCLIIMLITGVIALKKNNDHYSRKIILFMVFVCVFASFYYFISQNHTYQLIRFVELGHLYIVCLFCVGLYYLFNSKLKYISLVGALFFSFITLSMVSHRFEVLQETVSKNPGFGDEFRDSKAIAIADYIRLHQTKEHKRVAYYKGPGDGVDFAGSGVLLRNVYYLPASGNSLAGLFNWQNFLQKERSHKEFPPNRIWKREWLEDAYVLIRPESDTKDNIHDLRENAAKEPMIHSDYLSLFDTKSQELAEVIGDAWSVPMKYKLGENEFISYRNLRDNEAAIVIWSQINRSVKINFVINADQKDSAVLITSDNLAVNYLKFKINTWDGDLTNSSKVSITADLKIGPNVIKVAPISTQNDQITGWLKFWDITIVPIV